MRLPLLVPSREPSEPELDDQTLLPSGIRRAAAPPPPRPAPPRPRPFGQLSWEDFEQETPVERVSAFLVQRAREIEYDPDEPPTRETPLDLATLLRSASVSDLGMRRAFDEPMIVPLPPPAEERPTLRSLVAPPPVIRIAPEPPQLLFVPLPPPAPPVESMATHLARGFGVGIASAITILGGFLAWRIAEVLLARM